LSSLDESLSSGGQRRLDVVQQEFNRIADIVGRLLDFQRPQIGEQQAVDVVAAVDYVLMLAEKQMQRSGVMLVQNLPDKLPPVWAVASQLKQVFLNLILNAAEAMPDGGQLTITACHDAGKLYVEFANTGPGLPPAVQARLFDPFFTTKKDGSGLGLAVSHEIIANHEGTLTVHSVPGKGATYLVMLPICAVNGGGENG
jgi:signal transduction histidine kinase